MKTFSVTVRTATGTCHTYPAIAACSADVIVAAIDQFGLCAVFVAPVFN